MSKHTSLFIITAQLKMLYLLNSLQDDPRQVGTLNCILLAIRTSPVNSYWRDIGFKFETVGFLLGYHSELYYFPKRKWYIIAIADSLYSEPLGKVSYVMSIIHTLAPKLVYLSDGKGPFYLHGLTLISAWISNHIHYESWDQLIIHSLTSTGQPLTFRNG